MYWLKRAGDPYGLFHLTLNKLPGEDPLALPKTEWLNMGFWKDTAVFPKACAALATKLIQAADCKDSGQVLDVGHGTGESLILLLSDPSVPRPSGITGITSLPAHHLRSRERVRRLQASSKGPQPEVALYKGDAVYRHPAIGHPLDPSSTKLFDTILALDCAYHFDTRETFLLQSFNKLALHGRIALADICFDPAAPRSRWVRLAARVFKLMPQGNFVSKEGYVAQMEGIGYGDIRLEDVTEEVFPGFIRFLKGRGWGWAAFGLMVEWYQNAGARFVIVSGSKRAGTL